MSTVPSWILLILSYLFMDIHLPTGLVFLICWGIIFIGSIIRLGVEEEFSGFFGLCRMGLDYYDDRERHDNRIKKIKGNLRSYTNDII